METNTDKILSEHGIEKDNTMNVEEKKYFLNIIEHCKDICDTENSVDDQTKCQIVQLNFSKEYKYVNFNGFLTIGTDKLNENRTIEGDIYLGKNEIIVDSKITRLCVDCDKKVYRVTDCFVIEDEKLKRKSQYNYNMENIYDEINDEELKGKLR